MSGNAVVNVDGNYIKTYCGLFRVEDFDCDELKEMARHVRDELKLSEKQLWDHVRLADNLNQLNKLITEKKGAVS